jgi:APA family basic amino acid/polyamine antiporter
MELKRTLKLPAVVFIAVGFAIGGGVFVLTGIVHEMVGGALPAAYALAAVPVFVSMLPLAMLAAAVPATGASYVYPSRMVSPALAFVGIWVYALASFFGQIPLWALGCARYVQPYLPGLPEAGTALLLVTFLYIVNYRGIEPAVQVQAIGVVVLIAALILYTAAAFRTVPLERIAALPAAGSGKLLLGTALLTFTYFGPNGIIELGAEIVRPGRVIPRAFGISFLVVAAIYVAVAAATAAVLADPAAAPPAGAEPLSHVSRLTGGAWGSAFFVFGGAVLALLTTLNALFIVGTRALLMLAEDGLLPASAAVLHPRFGTPHRLLTLIWILSAAGILSGVSLQTLASYSALGAMIIFLPLMIAAIRLPKLYPGHYRRSAFKLKGLWFWLCPAVGILMVLFFGAVILVELGTLGKVSGFFGFIASGILYYAVRRRGLRGRAPAGRPFPAAEDSPDA